MKKLVAYFSASGVTRKAAEELAAVAVLLGIRYLKWYWVLLKSLR